jgi:F-type H+-transporting ATPase subunit epsilon
VTLHVELVAPDHEIWSGSARMVIAKTLEGDIGVLQSHPPVLGILAQGSVVRILDPDTPEGSDDSSGGEQRELAAAVSGGFFSVADDRVSILARDAEFGHDVDVRAARAELEAAEASGAPEESAEARYARARLRAAGEQS